MMGKVSFGILVSIVWFLAGCSLDLGTSKPKTSIYFTKGDPLTFVENDQRDTQVFTKENLFRFDRFFLIQQKIFTEKYQKPVAKATHRNLEEENAPTKANENGNVQQSMPAFQFVQRRDGTLWFVSRKFGLEFQESNGFYAPVAVEDGVGKKAMVPLHLSVSHDERFFSLLLYGELPGAARFGKVLMALVFAKDADAEQVEMGDTKFNYIFGPGKKMSWRDGEVTLLGCALSAEDQAFVKKGLEPWGQLINGRLSVQVQFEERCPPFSDLSTQTIRNVDNYLAEYDRSLAMLGVTLPVPDDSNSAFIDSDIFLLSRELGKHEKRLRQEDLLYGTNRYETMRTRTMSHEFGHFLGLHHIFDGTSSIMSYNDEDIQLTEYDREAIHELYPLQSEPTEDSEKEEPAIRFLENR